MATTPSDLLSSKPAFTPSSRSGGVFDLELVEERPGIIVLRVAGKEASATFGNEAGGHRWQEDSDGRVHTSTITVAVLPEPTEVQIRLQEEDLEYSFCRGSGAGGQHRNKTETAVQLRHLPTGTLVRCDGGRSQSMNKDTALQVLRARLWEDAKRGAAEKRFADRKRQVGSGMRGDKRRTIRTQDDSVVDHESGKSWRYKAYSRGDW